MFKTLIHRPDWRQVIICLTPYLFVTVMLLYFSSFHIFFLHELCLYAGFAALVWTFYQFFWYMKLEYIITDEQIICLHGVFYYTTDYMELYRVVDYQQTRSLIQQLTRIKTVTLLSGDRNMRTLDIIGVKEQEDMIQEIRNRVESNKRRKGIYEITNR